MAINGFGMGGFYGGIGGNMSPRLRTRTPIVTGADMAMARMGMGGNFGNNIGMGYAMMNTVMPCMFAGGMLPLLLLGGGGGYYNGGMPHCDTNMASSMNNVPMGQIF